MRFQICVLILAFGTISNGQIATKIIGGIQAKQGSFPYLVSLQKTMPQGIPQALRPLLFRKKPFCAATILPNPKYLLTAAHCVDNIRGSILAVAGVTNLEDFNDTARQERVIEMGDVIKHPDFRLGRDFIENDIALIRLKEPFNTTTENVSSIVYPTIITGTFDGANFSTAGWGQTRSSIFSGASTMLHEVALPFVNKDECRKAYPRYNIRDDVFCAGGQQEKGVCNGDSGGPLILEREIELPGIPIPLIIPAQYGILSWVALPNSNQIQNPFSSPCGLEGSPVVATNVFKYAAWIEENTR